MKLIKILKLIPCFYLPILFFLINQFVFLPLKFYQYWWWFDVPMHFIGGAVIAYSLILVLRRLKEDIVIKDYLLGVIIVLGLLSLIMISWEFYEYAVRMIIDVPKNSLEDTLSDFLFGIIGGVIVAFNIRINVTTI